MSKDFMEECAKRGLKPKLSLEYEREDAVHKEISTIVNAKVNIVNLDEEQAKLDKFVEKLSEARTLLRELASSGQINLYCQITGLDGNAACIEGTQRSDQETRE